MGVPVLTNSNSGLDAAQLPADLVHVYDANRPALAPLAELAAAVQPPGRAATRSDQRTRLEHPNGAPVEPLIRAALRPTSRQARDTAEDTAEETTGRSAQ